MIRLTATFLGAALATSVLAAPAWAATEISFYYPIAVGGPIPPIQPSEFAKLALVIYVSAWLAGRGEHVKTFWLGFFPCVVLVGFVAGLVMLEPDLGTAIVMVLTTMTLVFIAGASLTHVAAFAGIGSIVATMLVLAGEYRTDRIFAFVNAEDDPSVKGFQTLQMLIGESLYHMKL